MKIYLQIYDDSMNEVQHLKKIVGWLKKTQALHIYLFWGMISGSIFMIMCFLLWWLKKANFSMNPKTRSFARCWSQNIIGGFTYMNVVVGLLK